MINAVVTRSKEKRLSLEREEEASDGGLHESQGTLTEFISLSEEREADILEIPAFDGGGEMSLVAVKSAEFMDEQRKCPDLQPLWDKAQGGVEKEFKIITGKLVRVARTRREEEIRQISYRHGFGKWLKVKPSICKFAQEKVLFLGHKIGSKSRSPSDLKIKAIEGFLRPATKTQVRSFLGLVGYYAHYIPNYSAIASLLTDALKGKTKKEKITWDEGREKAFQELKAKLVSQPILFSPDFVKEFILQTVASEVSAGVVLSQRIEGEEHPTDFFSKKISNAEQSYSTVERELAAIVFGLKRLKQYLDVQKIVIETTTTP
ncbi:retrovirus-related Pol polyprotein from transposon 17.6 [Trichonephila clavata]|uniref:RNA-directed DNA polymerase n=1 Tax=Trichonephila clavata TaxID=2740835 RepID=A0A8X6LX87_TRICU|nr:retrovirus-related Pol polyprotein from transposon 17.6 [Trichonephila clavata]